MNYKNPCYSFLPLHIFENMKETIQDELAQIKEKCPKRNLQRASTYLHTWIRHTAPLFSFITFDASAQPK